MSGIRGIALIAGLLLLAATVAASADCNSAISQYNSAVSDIESRLRRFANCVSNSRGTDDCSSEFRRLRSAHSDFENAVSEYSSYCRR